MSWQRTIKLMLPQLPGLTSNGSVHADTRKLSSCFAITLLCVVACCLLLLLTLLRFFDR